MPTRHLLVAVVFLCLGWIACGDGSDGGGPLAGLTDEELTAYNAAIDSLSETAGFELIRPTYLPAGTDWLPSTDYIADSETAVLQFYPADSTTQIAERPLILIDQVADPNGRVCPPCPGLDKPGFERYSLGKTELVLDQGRSGEHFLFLAIYFRAGNLRVHASFDWELDPDAPLALTEDMREEALKVVESMLAED